jgi:uncharacterized protein
VDPFPRWPVWYGPVALGIGFGCGLVGGFVLIPALAGVAAVTEASFEETLPALGELATIVQDAGLVAVAVLLAARTVQPRAWHFGLRRTRLLPALGLSLAALAVFWVFVLPLELLPEPATEEISPKAGLALLLVLGFVLIVVAPVAEEFFFRGFFYRSLRAHMTVLPAAVVCGAVFGAVHFANGLIAVPLITIFGFILCLVYERTGSLYPCIAIHSAHNTLVAVLAADAGAGIVFAAMGAVTVAVALALAALTPAGDPPSLRREAFA